jgi:phosphoribosylformimino-5-aminoimidazole carboxamide ribotide isomerase
MLIIPAVDIKDGQVVRLAQGSFKEKRTYSSDPVKTARHWARQGARLIHVVDLDGAASGSPEHLDTAVEIAATCGVPVEFGGGMRSLGIVAQALNLGIARVVLGTKAAEDEDFLKRAYAKFKEKVVVSVDARDEKVVTRGWQKNAAGLNILTFALRLKRAGFKEFIYTDISKDGMLKGPNLAGVKSLLKASGMQIIASGGISSLEDIRRLKSLEKEGLAGIIVGKALYEGKFTLKQGIEAALTKRRDG